VAASIDKIYEKFELSLFPNPVKNVIEIETEKMVSNSMIYDVTGKVLVQTSNQTRINVSSLSSGVYFIKIFTGNNVQRTLKFIKN
jgi:hypothetical protein